MGFLQKFVGLNLHIELFHYNNTKQIQGYLFSCSLFCNALFSNFLYWALNKEFSLCDAKFELTLRFLRVWNISRNISMVISI